MGFTPTFYASRPKLSEVTIDSDLNMGGRDISGVDALQADTIDVDLIRAGRVDSPYMPETWPTETLDWGDGEPSDPVVVVASSVIPTSSPLTTAVFTAVELAEIAVTVKNSRTDANVPIRCYARVDGVNVVEYPVLNLGESHTVALVVRAGESVSVYTTVANPGLGMAGRVDISYVLTGGVVGEKIFDLTDKWLSPVIDMHNVPATVVIQGVEMPYSDYLKYFPLAPSELKFPADWENGRIRPIIEVYK